MTFYRFWPNPDLSYGSGSFGVWTYTRYKEKFPNPEQVRIRELLGDVVNGSGFRVSKSGFMIYELGSWIRVRPDPQSTYTLFKMHPGLGSLSGSMVDRVLLFFFFFFFFLSIYLGTVSV
jgi:hypothetical protein